MKRSHRTKTPLGKRGEPKTTKRKGSGRSFSRVYQPVRPPLAMSHCGHYHKNKDEELECSFELKRLANAVRELYDLDPLPMDGHVKFKSNEERFALQSHYWPSSEQRPPRRHA